MPDDERGRRPRAVVWVRDPSPPPGDPRRALLSRLRELATEGPLGDLSVRSWGRFVDASPPEAGADRPIRARIAEFYEWADRSGHSLAPAFRRCERSTMLAPSGTEVIRLPLVCVAMYDDDRLVGVFPCSTDGETNTVPECVDRLERGDTPTRP
jgi:hypothetical protein